MLLEVEKSTRHLDLLLYECDMMKGKQRTIVKADQGFVNCGYLETFQSIAKSKDFYTCSAGVTMVSTFVVI